MREAPSPHSVHLAWVVLTRSIAQALTYDCRLVPPEALIPIANQLDGIVKDVIVDLTRAIGSSSASLGRSMAVRLSQRSGLRRLASQRHGCSSVVEWSNWFRLSANLQIWRGKMLKRVMQRLFSCSRGR